MAAGSWHHIGNVKGSDGVGVPEGGARGQILRKLGQSDYAAGWDNLSYNDITGKVPASALPQISNEPYVVNSQAAMLNLPAVPGRMAIRTDIGKTFVLSELPASTLANWVELTTSSDVNSVNGKTGNVTLTKEDIELGNVENTADADKPLATQAVRGLMAPMDKLKLDTMTSAATADRGVMRDENGRSSFRQIVLSDAPAANNHAATRAYVDDEVNRLVAGRTPISGSTTATNWDALTNTSVAAVVEGFPKGAPAGWPTLVLGQRTASDGFVVSPVWEFKHEALGLDYRKQTAKLLSCDPDYMIGFTWERYYHPGKSRWSSWTCVAGDTGKVQSVSRDTAWTTNRGAPFVYTPANIYNEAAEYRPVLRRIVNEIHFEAVFTVKGATALEYLSGAGYGSMPTFGWLPSSRRESSRLIWIPPREHGTPLGVMTGSSHNTWSVYLTTAGAETEMGGYRYGPSPATGNVYLPVKVSWPAPFVSTWGSSWVAGDGA